MNTGQASVVAKLGTAQTLAWASSYYLPAILAAPMARDLSVSVPTIFAAFSVALLVAAALGPLAGRRIDQYGGRPILILTNLVFAAGLAALAMAQDTISLFAAWALIGVGMGSGLYEAAFSTLVKLYGKDARRSITGITLIAGFASTLGWPLSAWFETQFGWRGACWAWAALHLAIGIPLNALLANTEAKPASGAIPGQTDDKTKTASPPARDGRYLTILLAFVFAVTWFISTAMAAHLPRLLEASGISLAAAVAMSALVGPAQVAARLLEFGVLSKLHPLFLARLAALAHPAGAALLIVTGGFAAPVFTILHGAGNGILTIAKGTLPLVIFGTQDYGARQGLLMVPARVVQAFSPLLFGLLIDHWGIHALWVSGLLGFSAFWALFLLSRR